MRAPDYLASGSPGGPAELQGAAAAPPLTTSLDPSAEEKAFCSLWKILVTSWMVGVFFCLEGVRRQLERGQQTD